MVLKATSDTDQSSRMFPMSIKDPLWTLPLALPPGVMRTGTVSIVLAV